MGKFLWAVLLTFLGTMALVAIFLFNPLPFTNTSLSLDCGWQESIQFRIDFQLPEPSGVDLAISEWQDLSDGRCRAGVRQVNINRSFGNETFIWIAGNCYHGPYQTASDPQAVFNTNTGQVSYIDPSGQEQHYSLVNRDQC